MNVWFVWNWPKVFPSVVVIDRRKKTLMAINVILSEKKAQALKSKKKFFLYLLKIKWIMHCIRNVENVLI